MFCPRAITFRESFVLIKIFLKMLLRSHRMQFRQPWMKNFVRGRKVFRPKYKINFFEKKSSEQNCFALVDPRDTWMQFWKPCPKTFAKTPDSFCPTSGKVFWNNKLFKTNHFPQSYLLDTWNAVLTTWPEITSLKFQKLIRLISKTEKKPLITFIKKQFRSKLFFRTHRFHMWHTCWLYVAKRPKIFVQSSKQFYWITNFFNQNSFSSILTKDRYIGDLTTLAKTFSKRLKIFRLKSINLENFSFSQKTHFFSLSFFRTGKTKFPQKFSYFWEKSKSC